jgi:NAD(P)-dependent dehydrogenase (short-subunit alcohol dehydrogenase family)
MSRIFVITGSASGIGKATADRLRGQGHRVIGADIRNAEVICDLSTPAGRADLVEKVRTLAPDGINGVLTSAGAAIFERPGFSLATNYFGTVGVILGLHPLLRAPGARCVTIASTALLHVGEEALEIEALCLAGDEAGAVALADKHGLMHAYPAAKRALTKWSRHQAILPEWAAAGILINTVAPGTVKTPMIADALADPRQAATIREKSVIAVDDFAEAEDLAEVIDFLLNCRTMYLIGQLIYVDGGSEAILRPNL